MVLLPLSLGVGMGSGALSARRHCVEAGVGDAGAGISNLMVWGNNSMAVRIAGAWATGHSHQVNFCRELSRIVNPVCFRGRA